MLTASLLTADDLTPMLDMMRQILSNQQAAAQPTDDYLSVEQVAEVTGFGPKTVRKWMEKGKAGLNGQIIKLFFLEFAPGYPRIPRSALLAFGLSQGFDAAQLAKPAPVLDSAEALRRAA